jgi:acetyl esterase/lipase
VTAAPPFFVTHGDHDSLIPVAAARLFVKRLRATSASPVVYAELPGAQHRFNSLRFEAVVDGIEAFAAWVRSSRAAAGADPARYDAAR